MTIAPNPSRSVFYGFGGWVGAQSGRTQCGFWPDDPNDPAIAFDQKKLIHVDLAKNPQAFLRQQPKMQMDEIEVDDAPTYGGGTGLGPTWPTGSTTNTVFLHSIFWDKLAKGVQPPRQPKSGDCFDYELTTVLYWSGPYARRRFWGVRAEIVQVQGTSMALTTLWPRGRSRVAGIPPAGTYWLDLASAHPIEPGFTTIGVGPNDPKAGALFIESSTLSGISLFYKTPWWYGAIAAT